MARGYTPDPLADAQHALQEQVNEIAVALMHVENRRILKLCVAAFDLQDRHYVDRLQVISLPPMRGVPDTVASEVRWEESK